MTEIVRAPPLEECRAWLDSDPIAAVPRALAERALGALARGDDARWAVRGPVPLVGIVVDTCASSDDVADLLPIAGRPGDLPPAAVDALLATAETIAAEGPRAWLEVALLPDRLGWRPILGSRGYEAAYTMVTMRRCPDPVTPAPMPTGLAWEAVSPARVADFHRVAGLAFAEIPGAMVPALDEFSRHNLAADPAPQLLVVGDRVVGYARVELDGHGDAEVAAIGRDPAARGQGLGELLITRALAMAMASSPTAITLTVSATNLRATRLYERHGFRAVSEVPVYRKWLGRS